MIRDRLSTIQKIEKLNEVHRAGAKGPGGAYHNYAVVNTKTKEVLAMVEFQEGPRKDPNSRHGVIDGDLLEMVRDRLRCFQDSAFACEENARALQHVEEALLWLNKRVEERAERNVLGTMAR